MATKRKEFERYIVDCFAKYVRLILQARNLSSPILGEIDTTFNLETEQTRLPQELAPWLNNVWYAPLVLDVYFKLPPKPNVPSQPILLERWKIVLDSPTNVTQSGAPYRKISFVIVLRSIYFALRLLPAYKLARGLRKNKVTAASFEYRLGQPDFSFPGFPADSTLDMNFGAIETPFGNLSMNVIYRREPGVLPSDLDAPISSRVIIPDYGEEVKRVRTPSISSDKPPNVPGATTITTGTSAPIGIPSGPAFGTSPIPIGQSYNQSTGSSFGTTPISSLFSQRFGTPLLSTSPPFGHQSGAGAGTGYTPPSGLGVTPPFPALLTPATLTTSATSNTGLGLGMPSSSFSRGSLGTNSSPPLPPSSSSPPVTISNSTTSASTSTSTSSNPLLQESLSMRKFSLFGSPPKTDEDLSVQSLLEEPAFALSSASASSYGEIGIGSFYRHVESAPTLKLLESNSTRTMKSLVEELERLKKEDFERKRVH